MSVAVPFHESVISSPSGMSYDLVLKPAAVRAKKPEFAPSPGRSLSSEALNNKMNAAEGRRRSRLEEVILRNSEETLKIQKAKAAVMECEGKLQRSVHEKRQARLAASEEKIATQREIKQQRLRKMLEKVDIAKMKREEMSLAKSKLAEEKCNKKMEHFEVNRNAKIEAMLDRLHAHDDYVAVIRCSVGREGRARHDEDELLQELHDAESNRADAVDDMLESFD